MKLLVTHRFRLYPNKRQERQMEDTLETCIHEVVNAFKGRTSHDLRKEFPELLKLPSLWTHSYFASTAGQVSSETIKKYIQEQSKS